MEMLDFDPKLACIDDFLTGKVLEKLYSMMSRFTGGACEHEGN
jgi:hypothetical protein